MKDLINIIGRAYKKNYLPFALLAILFMLLDVLTGLLIPRMTEVIFTRINKEVLVRADLNFVIKQGIFVILIALFAVVTTVLNNVCAQYVATKVTRDIRSDLFKKIQDLSFSNIDSITTGRLMTIVSNDTSQIQQIIMMSFRAILRSPLTLVGAIFMAYVTNPDLFIIVVIIAPLLALCIYLILSNATKLFLEMQKRLDDLNTKLHETVSGAREIKSFVTEINELEKFNKVNDDFMHTNNKIHKVMSLLDPTILLISNIGIAAVLYLSAILASKYTGDEKIELIGNISAYISYLQQIIFSLNMLSMVAMNISRGQVSARRINLVLNTIINITNNEKPIIKEIEGDIEYKDVCFGYLDEHGTLNSLTLKNISFKIPKNSIVGIIGSTGSGKTSLVQLLPRLYDVASGAVLIDGINVKDYDLNYLRKNISYVTQEAIIFSGTIESNIRQGKEDATMEEIKEAARLAVANEYIEKFNDQYNTVVNQRGANLSGGQKQRLALARALVRKPKILILDDCTSAVDAKSEALIKENLRTLKDMTVLIIAQKISSIKDADYIIVLSNTGELDGFGTHEELLKTSKVYQEIYNSQFGGTNE